ncbi:MAG: hypothetical protein ABFS86_02770 [Planctomycetota bacterium]
MPKQRRKQVVVDKRFQLGVAATIVIWMFSYLMLFSMFVVVAPVIFRMATGGQLPTVLEVYEDFRSIFARLIVPMTLSLTILGIHAVLFLHRVAGPAYRFKMWLKGVRDGDLVHGCYLRRADMLKDVASAMTETVEVLREDVAKAQAGDLSALDKYRTDLVEKDVEEKVEEPVAV